MGRFLAFLGMVAQGFACESVYVPPCAVGSQNDMIFVGTAMEESTVFGPFRFRIDEALKGVTRGMKEVEVGPGPCGAGYQAGKQYLILVHHLEGDQKPPGFSLGERVEDAAESITLFRALARGEHVSVIQGRIAENVADSSVRFEIDEEHRAGLSGVEITASKDGRNETTFSDFSGSYSLRVPEAGTYRIAAKLAGHAAAHPTYELNVAPDSCQELNLGMWTASRLTGHVIGADGKPAEGIAVQLESASDRGDFSTQVKTDAAGKFEFINIPEDDYVVGVNIAGVNSKLPYATRFYPGAPERSTAGIVKVTGAQTIEGLDFQIGKRKPTRRIVVAVEWSDGRPVINAGVVCSSSRSDRPGSRTDWVSQYVDLRGEATCEVLADRDFVVDANRLSWEASSRPVQPIASRPKPFVPAGTDTVRLRLVIDLVNDISAKEAPENMSVFNGNKF